MTQLASTVLEIVYIIIGLQLAHTAYCAFVDKTNPERIGTSLFWGLLALTFMFGKILPNKVVGIFVIIIALLTLFKKVRIGTLPIVDNLKAEKSALKLKNKIFIPVMAMAIFALLLARFLPDFSMSAIGISGILATFVILFIVKQGPKSLLPENNRMNQQVSTSGILPQLLGALGAIFTASGVGEVISQMIKGVVPADSRFFGVLAYVLGMVIFTMIMGNAFAAFTVITAGVGVPFVFALGADPIVASALAMTAGFCGTLLTPMAANFNALPVALMEISDPNLVIKKQAPVAFTLIIIHVALMYFLAF
ncbi:DUF979 domain-containing protein [Streptococcus uberis]|uniref:DUF979 domain-containing protein n=1 Tax=Streptococcus uberis TaxID=1349 RepID=UPI001FF65246|nr:DUF979 domain-containing protein [Streptococcus uberis]MCK1169853.1 DUF979 domain-containing protein [Streptococcus uberis]MCK1188316.1 DUF979 domain-containing protein [Streptococcus uberis]MCK1232423.1 DUF979 domain-containing protein [Streptococcus uberis]MCK1243528.1 DUF979 domain-containing protein [Streptococcus uberis]